MTVYSICDNNHYYCPQAMQAAQRAGTVPTTESPPPNGTQTLPTGMPAPPPGMQVPPPGMQVPPPGMQMPPMMTQIPPPGSQMLPTGMKPPGAGGQQITVNAMPMANHVTNGPVPPPSDQDQGDQETQGDEGNNILNTMIIYSLHRY